MIKPISFFTPVYTQNPKIAEVSDRYFYLGGKQAHRISGNQVELRTGKSRALYTALKIFSYFTVVLPLFFMTVKIINRSARKFTLAPVKGAAVPSPIQQLPPAPAPVPPPKPVSTPAPVPPPKPVSTPAPIPPPKPAPTIRELPLPPSGAIQNGYGEYLVYRPNAGKAEPISQKEYEQIFDLLEQGRSLDNSNKNEWLKQQIRTRLGQDIELTFIPRTLYEMLFVRACIQEDVQKGYCNNALETRIWSHLINSEEKQLKRKLQEFSWQHSLYEDADYKSNFAPKNGLDYRRGHLIECASRLNQVALQLLKPVQAEGVTYAQIQTSAKELLQFFQEVNDPKTALHQKILKLGSDQYVGIARECAEEEYRHWGKASSYPQGIATQRHLQIVDKALQIECSLEAAHSTVLYRGSKFQLDSLARNDSPNSLSYGTSLFAGALYDGGAEAFHYMRSRLADAHAILVPRGEQKSAPFHFFNVHPLIQVASKGEIFHSRSKVWKIDDKAKVVGWIGLGTIEYENLPPFLKSYRTQADLEQQFQKYKDAAYMLAAKEL